MIKKMNLRTKMILFISSYTPLFSIIGLQNLNLEKLDICDLLSLNIYNFILDNIVFIIFILICFLVNISFFVFLSGKNYSTEKIVIKKVENKNSEILSYFLPFIICFIPEGSIVFTDPISILIFLIIMFVLYKVYTTSNLIYLNIMLIIFNYKIYFPITDKNKRLIVISKEDIVDGSRIKSKKISNGLYIY